MKQLILLLILSLPLLAVRGQSKVSYTYDASGNRTVSNHVKVKKPTQEYKYQDITLKVENNRVYVYFPSSLSGATFYAYSPTGRLICRNIMLQSPLCAGPMPMERGLYIIRIQSGNRVIKELKISI